MSDKKNCRYGHPIDPSFNRCKYGGHPPRALELWNVPPERIGFLDIEATGLKADFSFMLTWFIKPLNGKPVGDRITRDDIFKNLDHPDHRIVKSLVKELKKYDIIITFYGANYDVKYIRTKALEQGIPFPFYGDIIHWDIYFVVKHKLLLSRNRLENSTRMFGIEGKNHVDWKYWRRAMFGDKKALDYVYDHNKRDVIVLEGLYKKMDGHWNKTRRSL